MTVALLKGIFVGTLYEGQNVIRSKGDFVGTLYEGANIFRSNAVFSVTHNRRDNAGCVKFLLQFVNLAGQKLFSAPPIMKE